MNGGAFSRTTTTNGHVYPEEIKTSLGPPPPSPSHTFAHTKIHTFSSAFSQYTYWLGAGRKAFDHSRQPEQQEHTRVRFGSTEDGQVIFLK